LADAALREALSHLPRIVVFAELARHGSFRATAAALGLAPSTVSHHLRALEDTLDVRLVERTSRAVKLTAAGEALRLDAEELLRAWKRGTARARLYATAPTGLLSVTAPEALVDCLVAPAVDRLLRQHPDVSVDLNVDSKTLGLMSESIDVAIRMGPLPDSGLGHRLLFRDRRAVFGAPVLAKRWAATSPEDLDGAPWVRFVQQNAHPTLHGPGGQTRKIRPSRKAAVNSSGALLSLLAHGVGFSMVPSRLATPHVAAGRLVRVLPDWADAPIEFYAVTPSPRPTDAKVVRFIDLLLEVVAELSR